MKKTTSILLALVMIFALAVPAFATQLAENQRGLDVPGETVAPTITVTMPSGVTLGLNPYKMKYAGTNAFFKNEKGKQDQILSPMAVIENKSDCKLSVEVDVTATGSDKIVFKNNNTATNGVTVVDTPETDGSIKKNVFLNVQIGEAKDKTGTDWKETTAPTAAVLVPDSSNVKKGKADYKVADSGTARADNAPTTGKMKAVELAATDGKVANYLGIKFTGAAAVAPTEAWAATDKIDVALVFTFNPVVLPTS